MNRTTIREHVETDLGDTAIERLIRDAFAAISTRHRISFTEEVASGDIQASFEFAESAFAIVDGGTEIIMLPQSSRLLGGIAEIGEWDDATETFIALESSDWQQWSARQIRRNFNGDIPPQGLGWASRVQVEYEVDMTIAERVVIDLVQLAIQYSALSSERAGDYSASNVEYQKERERLLSELMPAMGFA